jgi:hypothetical protein
LPPSPQAWEFVQGVADRLFADRLIRNANGVSVSLLKSDSAGLRLGGFQSGQDVLALCQNLHIKAVSGSGLVQSHPMFAVSNGCHIGGTSHQKPAQARRYQNRRLEFELGAGFEGFCGFALVLALSQMLEHGLGPFGRADLHLRRNPLDWQGRFAPQPGSAGQLAGVAVRSLRSKV